MSCMRPPNREPEFEQVTLRRPSLDFIPTAHSSPKLRLNFDDNDTLMSDPAFERIINKDDMDKHKTNPQNPQESPLLPPSPFVTANYPGHQRGIVYHCGDRSAAQDTPSKPGATFEIQKRMSSLRFQPRSTEVDSTEHETTGTTYKLSDTTAPVTPNVPGTGEKHRPRPISVVPRFGTLTALPGSTMIADAETDTKDYNELGSSTYISTVASTMPPPPLPHAPVPTPPHSTPATSISGRKRKLSMSAPFITNVKRFMSPISTKKPNITHTTHEATAINRDASGAGRNISTSTIASKDQNLQSRNISDNSPTIHSETPAPTHHSILSTPEPTYGSMLNPFRHRRNATASSAQSATSTVSCMSSAPAPEKTSKSAMNKLIISLRGEMNDLTLENRVLQDQVAIVRKDWIDTSQALDLERLKSWQSETECFKLGVRIEELQAKIRELEGQAAE